MKEKIIAGLTFLILGSVVLCVMGCGESNRYTQAGSTYYTKFNSHYYVKPETMKKFAGIQNFTKFPGHGIMPYNSQVSVSTTGQYFVLTEQQTGDSINVECKKKYMGGYSLAQYLDLILSDTPVSYPDLSDVDKKGISLGQPFKGMTKKGVKIALGYPLPSGTPSESSNTWEYWKGKLGHYPVNFRNGVVVSSGF